MRLFALVAACLFLLVACLFAPAAHAAGPGVGADGRCLVDGVWMEPTVGFTTKIAEGRWSTWTGVEADTNTRPAGSGWVAVRTGAMLFDYDGSEEGFKYEFSFEQECRVLHVWLFQGHANSDLPKVEIRFQRR
jgi:hypothetical protein